VNTHHNHLLYINQEVQTVLELIKARQIEVPVDVVRQADKLGALIYGLLRADERLVQRISRE
jgi:hypothetical protein